MIISELRTIEGLTLSKISLDHYLFENLRKKFAISERQVNHSHNWAEIIKIRTSQETGYWDKIFLQITSDTIIEQLPERKDFHAYKD